MRESKQVAALRAALGKCLADHRMRHGLKQAELAERLYYSRTSITKLETGQQPAPRDFWRAADELLCANGDLVVRFDALTALKAADRKSHSWDHGPGRAADALFGALSATMLPIAQARARARSASDTPDQGDIVIELEALTRVLAEHSRRVLIGEQAE